MLQSGVMDQGKIENSITSVPQANILSPILFNSYLFATELLWKVPLPA